ncbi:MAG: TRAM domain-containing protein [Candidatus Kappaea frigidicola]|nr:TRAM domain-containing protein [Candidatus Kappaea frigidicola]
MTIFFLRILFLIAGGLVGYQSFFVLLAPDKGYLGLIVGVGGALLIILSERISKNISLRGLSSAVFGLILGLIVAWLIRSLFDLIPSLDQNIKYISGLVITVILSYLGIVLSMRGRDEFNIIIPYVRFSRQDEQDEFLILDTSAIIDGRIADIAQTKFLGGSFIIPHFILRELQHIADSRDPLKRVRGRRGLDILNKLKKISNVQIKIHQQDFPDIGEVDHKLVKLAKVLEAKILTNDYNLNKVAVIQGVTVLNINELANALKPVVLPGEVIDIKIAKEGTEHHQGVGYLDDGTMIVVENSRHLLGRNVKATVTSVLQTTAGKMIFARMDNQGNNDKNKR